MILHIAETAIHDRMRERILNPVTCHPEFENDLPLPPNTLPITRHMGVGFPEVPLQRLGVHAGGIMTCEAVAF